MAGIDHGHPLPAVAAAMPRTLPSDSAFAKPGAGPECWPSSSRPSSWSSPSRSSSSSPGSPPSSSSTSSSQAAPSAAAAAASTAPLFPNAADDASPAGLSVAQLKGLPWFEYSGRSASPPWPPPDCTVCLEGFKKGERCRALPSCGHVFHVTCVDRWLAKSRGCPICRALVGVA